VSRRLVRHECSPRIDSSQREREHAPWSSQIQAADVAASVNTCHTALHFRQWQTVIVLRAVACTSVEPQIGQTLQVSGIARQP